MKTGVAQTSISTYHDLKTSGFLSKRQAEIMVHIQKRGKKVTRRQIAKALRLETSQVSGRVNELVAMNALCEFGTAKCRYSKKMVGLVGLPEMGVT